MAVLKPEVVAACGKCGGDAYAPANNKAVTWHEVDTKLYHKDGTPILSCEGRQWQSQ